MGFQEISIGNKERYEDADGWTVDRVRKRPSSRRLRHVSPSENITQHASQRLSVSPRPPPITDSAEREHLTVKLTV